MREQTDIWAVVPVKRFAIAKRRLASVLSDGERAELARLMLHDVLAALAHCKAHIAGMVVVTADAAATALAEEYGASVVSDEERDDINAAIRLGLDCVADNGGEGALIVPSDVPHLSPERVVQAVEAIGMPNTLVAIPAADDRGTNLLGCRPAHAVPLCFGPGSFDNHCKAARAQGMTVRVLPHADLGLDLDRPKNLDDFLALNSSTRTHAFLVSRGAKDTPQLENRSDDDELTGEEAYGFVDLRDLDALMKRAAARRDRAHGQIISYSRKVFIPLTKLCRDVCHYCTFAQPPRAGERAFLTCDEVLAIARAGRAAGCKEALFTLGDKPEMRYRAAREELAHLGHATTLSYLAEMAHLVFEETGLLPHLNPGLLDADDLAALKKVSVSQGIMLESASARLMQKGGPHYGSPDKNPAARLMTIRLAGEQHIPFTTGILIGIGETRRERVDALIALRDLHEKYGHIQEIIIQNFRPKSGTRMADVPPPSVEEHLWTIAVARLIFPPSMSIQAPPNLSPGALRRLVEAGINDWGGVSPVTPDHVNPEAPWPHLQVLERATNAAGKQLHERLAIYPSFAADHREWVDPALHTALLRQIDGDGWPRVDDWSPGAMNPLPHDAKRAVAPAVATGEVAKIIDRAVAGRTLTEFEIVKLFQARDDDFAAVCAAADALRQEICGDAVSYVVTRNVNYTNICYFKCQFCAFSKGKMSENLRGRPYNLSRDEIATRTREAWARGATEVCMQGGIHPDFDGQTYIDICKAVRAAAPGIHVHAFSPLEVHQGAATLGLPLEEFFLRLKDAGLGTLPGTAAEVLDDDVRAMLCRDKINTARWLEIMRAAHGAGFKTTATIMFGHVDGYRHWARHLLRLRALQEETGGFTEFVPLPFVHMEAPIYLKGRARRGPTFREAILMHAVARLAFHPVLTNVQTSWVKMGPEGVRICLRAGANDLGGTLMDETITRSAGAQHGQEMTPEAMEHIIRSIGRVPRQRNTIYGDVSPERYRASFLRDHRASAAVAIDS